MSALKIKKQLLLSFKYCNRTLFNRIIIFLGLAIILTACQKNLLSKGELSGSSQAVVANISSASSANATTLIVIPFSATAMIAYCYGENIAFSGTIENRVTTTTDMQGVIHYTRHFTTRGLTGVGSGVAHTVYDVVGGAEMFSVKDAVLNPNGTLNVPGSLSASDIVIHEGTLVFVSRTDGTRVIARHVIRKVPSGILENHWVCAGN